LNFAKNVLGLERQVPDLAPKILMLAAGLALEVLHGVLELVQLVVEKGIGCAKSRMRVRRGGLQL
jgi:hypothetical protein